MNFHKKLRRFSYCEKEKLYSRGGSRNCENLGFFVVQTSHCSSHIKGWGCISTEHAHWEWGGSCVQNVANVWRGQNQAGNEPA